MAPVQSLLVLLSMQLVFVEALQSGTSVTQQPSTTVLGSHPANAKPLSHTPLMRGIAAALPSNSKSVTSAMEQKAEYVTLHKAALGGLVAIPLVLLALLRYLQSHMRPKYPMAYLVDDGQWAAASGNQYSVALYATSSRKPVILLQPKTNAGKSLHQALTRSPDSFAGVLKSEVTQLSNSQSNPERSLAQLFKELGGSGQEQSLQEAIYYSVVDTFVKKDWPQIEPKQLKGTLNFEPIDLPKTKMVTAEELTIATDMAQARTEVVLGNDVSTGAKTKLCKFQIFELYRTGVSFGYFLRFAANSNLQGLSLKEFMLRFAALGSFNLEFARRASVETVRATQEFMKALFGDVPALMQQLQDAISDDPNETPAAYRQRMASAAASPKRGVETIATSTEDLQRLFIEAVILGTCMKDVEDHIDALAGRPLLRRLLA